nr:uncharacterized protein LOC113709895 [Coffea arabica]
MEVYVDDIIIKSKKAEDHLMDLRKLFERLRKYNLKLNPAKCAFGAPAGKLLGFIVSKKGIEIDPPPVLVPPKLGRPLIMYLSVLDGAVGCVLGQHDDSGRKKQAIYYLSKKFTQYEANYSFIEKNCCALAWAAQKLRHYLLSHTTYLISGSDPLKYLLERPMPTGRLAKWQMILSEFDICFTSQKAIKGQAIADHLAENPKDDDYQPLHTYFPDEKVLFVGAVEDMSEQCPEWILFFDCAANSYGVGIGAVLVSPKERHYPGAAKLQFACTNNMAEYETCIFGLKMALEMEVKELIAFSDSDLLVHQMLKQWVTKDSKILPYHYNSFGKSPWYNDIKEFIKTGSYPPDASTNDKGFLRRMASKFFLNGEVLYKRTSDLNLLRCIDEDEAQYMMKEVHSGVCGSHMNGHLLAKKIMRTGYFWLTMERDCIDFVQRCIKCQLHGDVIRAPPTELHSMIAPWPCLM